MPDLGSVCVFLGSSPGADPAYGAAARATAAALVERGSALVYGGGKVGLMGILADAVLEGGGEVIGVIPRSLAEREVAHAGCTELVVTDGLIERKAEMLRRSDAFVSLPGGLGTVDEMFEVLTWTQLGEFSKPSGVLDVGGYWNPLHDFLTRAVRERFLRPEHLELLQRNDDPGRLLDALAAWRPTTTDKWLDR